MSKTCIRKIKNAKTTYEDFVHFSTEPPAESQHNLSRKLLSGNRNRKSYLYTVVAYHHQSVSVPVPVKQRSQGSFFHILDKNDAVL